MYKRIIIIGALFFCSLVGFFIFQKNIVNSRTEAAIVNDEDNSSGDVDRQNGIDSNESFSNFKTKKGILEQITNEDSRNVSKKGNEIKKKVSILFLGDVMLDRYNRILIGRHGVGYFTEKIERLFWGQDLNVVNLEGPITREQSVSVGKSVEDPNHFRFTFDPEQTVNFLQANRINLVNIGNNHILNFHNEGLEQTEDVLREGGISYFGNPLDLEKIVIVKNMNNRQIAFVNYNQFGKFTVADTVKIIQEVKHKTDFVIVYTHWGREYELVENDRQRNKAHQFIDAGADLIMGSHPHVVQPIEIYQGKVIFYSLGNFVFDQYFSEDVKSILGVGVLLEDDKISFSLIPLYMQNNGQLEMMDGERKQKFLQNLTERSKIGSGQKDDILELGEISLEYNKL